MPWVEGGRTLAGLDCLGVCLEMAKRRGIPYEDPWRQVAARWQAGERDIRRLFRFSPEWSLVEHRAAALDDLILFALRREEIPCHAGWIVAPGLVLSSRQGVGCYCHPYHRMLDRVVQVWRYQP